MAIFGALNFTACGGGGGGGGGSTPTTQTSISGSAMKGSFSSGTVTIYNVTSTGAQGAVLGMGPLAADGSFSVEIGNHSGPVFVEVSGGSYRNEADGMATTQLQELNGLISVVPANTDSTIVVTPLTTMAASFAAGNVITGNIPGTIDAACARIAAYFTLPDLESVTPVDLGTTTATAGSDVATYSLILAGLSQYASSLGVETTELVEALALDVRDGVLDGMAGSTQITINSQNLAGDAAQDGLAAAIAVFVNSANNNSGLSAMDASNLTNTLANRSQNTLFPVSLAITPNPGSVAFNATLQLTATVTLSDNSTNDVSSTVTWMSNDTNTATVSTSGLVSGVAPGNVMISATSSEDPSVVAAASIEITNPITAISVSPNSSTISQNATQAFTAMATRADNTMEDVTSSVTWESSNTSVATINASGLATGVGPGSTMIRATDAATSVTNAVTLTVTPIIVSIAITPGSPMISLGSSAQLTATATLSDSTTMDISSSATWMSSNTNTASVSATGQVTGNALGMTMVSATDPGTNVSQSVNVAVTDVVTAISIMPSTPTVAAGLTVQLMAEGMFSGGGTVNMTSSVNWTSSATNVATIDATGLVTSLAQGMTMIRAVDPSTNLEDTVTLMVSAPIVSTLTVAPSTASVGAGGTQQFTAMATMSDGSMMAATNTVMWSSSSTNVAMINASGLATSANQGNTTISARDPGTNVSDTAMLTVTAPTIVSITITPSTSIEPSTVRQLAAIATLSNSQTQNVTSSVTWMSSNTNAAQMTAGSWLITRVSGSATITATHTSSQVSGQLQISLSGNAPTVSFNSQVRPLFNQYCVSCHGTDGGLSLASYGQALSGGNSGPAFNASNGPASNTMTRMLTTNSTRMPPSGPQLSGAEMTTILRWIDQGLQNN